MNTQSIGGLPSGYMSFPLEIYGKSTVQGHGFELEGTLTDMTRWDSKHSGGPEDNIFEYMYTYMKAYLRNVYNQIPLIKECKESISAMGKAHT